MVAGALLTIDIEIQCRLLSSNGYHYGASSVFCDCVVGSKGSRPYGTKMGIMALEKGLRMTEKKGKRFISVIILLPDPIPLIKYLGHLGRLGIIPSHLYRHDLRRRQYICPQR